jgi:hypothetical protein
LLPFHSLQWFVTTQAAIQPKPNNWRTRGSFLVSLVPSGKIEK